MDKQHRQAGSARTIFLLAVAVSAVALFGISAVREESLIDMMAKVLTQFVVPVNAIIMFAFACIISLVAGVFGHYYLFELRQKNCYDANDARRLAQTLRASDKSAEQRISEAKAQLQNDATLFGQIMRRFLNENGFGAQRPGEVWQALQDEEFERVGRSMMYFSLASVLAPALGFLGTAVGMVAAFYQISIADHVTPATLATSIQIALITTVIGLVIKTITMLLKTMVVQSIGRREDQMTLAWQRLFER